MQTKKKLVSKAKVKPSTKQMKLAHSSPKKTAATKAGPKKAPLKKSAAVSKAPSKVKLPPEFTMKQVKEVVALIKDAGVFTTFSYKTEEFEIELSVGGAPEVANPIYAAAPIPMSAPSNSGLASPEIAPSQALKLAANERLIVSPMVGTFYRRPSPNSAPFVEVGDVVSSTADICIVEVMKLLSTIPAGCDGRISKILVEDGASIDVGQALMIIEVA
ncbi:acetyl-CoA carboxylase biotin carboxyl carrier protein [Polynucleobacter sp. 71A-WALBACH]|uniref:acetyl-CoA carboxylase biotin carboxyl carrier protein n=1 Tax=Polynucleobacter sp. 71A-WALBACH TaxID=2689097 RepID=UPI001C0C5763|nr:acetyl-CoA carboxylase biotin carboxyl carrier protein [Polynucleobacter sp. 71A-WALBACH]